MMSGAITFNFAADNSVSGAPLVSSFSPEAGAPGDRINIYGTNLIEVSAVVFNGTAASFSSFISGTNGVAIVPTNSASGAITVTTSKGAATSAGIFTILTSGPPTITSFSPIDGEAGTSIEIDGTNLSGVTSVQFNGSEASFSLLAGLLFANVPATATTGLITVKTKNGTITSTQVFTVKAPSAPVIASFSPNAGEAGTSVEIKGTNLSDTSSVKFGGVDAAFSLLGGSLFAFVPASAQTGAITVTTAGGSFTTATVFTITQRPPPIISGFSPVSGAPGVSVEIQGTNLSGATSVKFNGVPASFLPLAGSLRATVPLNATSGPISVTTPAGSDKSKDSFTVTAGPAPVITSFSPTSGDLGASVEIQGQFLRDILSVKFNGEEAAFTNALFRPLTAFVPTNATTGLITVVTRGGTATSTSPFTVKNPVVPIIDSLSPLSGAPGSLVNIQGTNLTGVLKVDFKGTEALFIEFTSARLLVFVPTNAVSGPVTVTSRFGKGASKDIFTVINPTPPLEPPTLGIRLLAQDELELSWKSEATGFALQSSDSIGASANWTNENVTSTVAQGQLVVTKSISDHQKFYRLIRPQP